MVMSSVYLFICGAPCSCDTRSCDQRSSRDSEHHHCGDSSVKMGTSAEGLVMNVRDDGGCAGERLLAG